MYVAMMTISWKTDEKQSFQDSEKRRGFNLCDKVWFDRTVFLKYLKKQIKVILKKLDDCWGFIQVIYSYETNYLNLSGIKKPTIYSAQRYYGPCFE